MTNRAKWEEMSGSAKLEAAKKKAASAPVGNGLVKKAVNTIVSAEEKRKQALKDAGVEF
jgi:hypothetical protein